MAKNKVIAGDYEGNKVTIFLGSPSIALNLSKSIPLDKTTVESYELVTEEHRKSAVSGIARGLVGGALLGPVGLLAGLSAKNKGTHLLAIEFKNEKKSLIEIDEKIYRAFIKKMF
ncbi:hypothetical protein V7122_02540 [Bacillus sp. JJ1532]|uniref:hypothetical protein n=1 Tax=Bacillus sp. JJ1532 TaxID=3122958 RepID=UPI002FFE0371